MPREYPVDPAARWATYRPSDDTVLKRDAQWPGPDFGPVPGLSEDLVLLRHTKERRPDHDNETQRLRRAETIDLDSLTISEGWEVVDRPAPSDYEVELKSATAAIEAGRASMRDSWQGLPARLRGPFHPLYKAANDLLDEGDREAAIELIEATEPTGKIRGNSQFAAQFDAVKQAFLGSIAALPEIPTPPPEPDPIIGDPLA